MTAEITVMNKMAIAMAADSAVTIHRGRKILNSANKLFMLSKYHPVGIMIYGSAEVMGYPWETLIKTYRRELGERSFPTISEFGSHFIEWIKNKLIQAPHINQIKYCEQMIYLAYAEVYDAVREKAFSLDSQADDSEFEKSFTEALDDMHRLWKQIPTFNDVPKNTLSVIKKNCSQITAEVIKSFFGEFVVGAEHLKKLSEIAAMCFIKERFSPAYSGIVIAGFGDEQDFPAIVDFKIDGIINKWLKYSKENDTAIDCNNSACIIPFAQGDVVSTFVEGIEPQLESVIQDSLKELLAEKAEVIMNELGTGVVQLNEGDLSLIQTIINSCSEQLYEEFATRSEEHKRAMHVIPVVQAIDVLPIDELASAAEALVNLTSFKRRVSMDQETVGGPIDVAVISKGDGFIWIKRKHYFDADRNHHYLNNRYQGSYQMKGGDRDVEAEGRSIL